MIRKKYTHCASAGLALLFLIGCTMPATSKSVTGGCAAGADQGQSAAGLAQTTLCITSGAKTRAFTVEVAGSSMEQAKGMMFRTELADNAGMIFPFPQPKPASFWMKNTVIPLDIIFVRPNGTIESIAENTVPYSTMPVTSGEPVGAVLELRGGLTAELGIAAGDKVVWKAR
jgi:uncharacterized membrane protein (UPF0127 family)